VKTGSCPNFYLPPPSETHVAHRTGRTVREHDQQALEATFTAICMHALRGCRGQRLRSMFQAHYCFFSEIPDFFRTPCVPTRLPRHVHTRPDRDRPRQKAQFPIASHHLFKQIHVDLDSLHFGFRLHRTRSDHRHQQYDSKKSLLIFFRPTRAGR